MNYDKDICKVFGQKVNVKKWKMDDFYKKMSKKKKKLQKYFPNTVSGKNNLRRAILCCIGLFLNVDYGI